jgi:hypothetical protein
MSLPTVMAAMTFFTASFMMSARENVQGGGARRGLPAQTRYAPRSGDASSARSSGTSPFFDLHSRGDCRYQVSQKQRDQTYEPGFTHDEKYFPSCPRPLTVLRTCFTASWAIWPIMPTVGSRERIVV